MNWNREWKYLAGLTGLFVFFFFLPVGFERFDNAIFEALYLMKWYAREHVILCLVPALFIAGAIAVFVSQNAVMKYFGAKANKIISYAVASVSGTILAVCSCTILPLFAGIYKRGAGLGPAIAFLYAGPAINILAIALTARILGFELGIARALGAVLFSLVIGLSMHFIFRKEELDKVKKQIDLPQEEELRPLWQTIIYFGAMVGILIFANWAKPSSEVGIWHLIYIKKWILTSFSSVIFAFTLIRYFDIKMFKVILTSAPAIILAVLLPDYPVMSFSAGFIGLSYILNTTKGEMEDWFVSSWDFAKMIVPLLFIGVIAAGFLLGRPGHEGIIPSQWVEMAVGGNSLRANFFSSIVGAFMYFATLTEVPILEGLMGNGMGKGPALALLLSGPALSLPNMLVLRQVMGNMKTIVFVILVIIMSTAAGMIYGTFF
ncbi:MAG: permease [Elusimicrobiales bacterium]|nr:permease [Elusimicrobiales bacterium]